ncbi:unnamed protein product [Paramecium pentaurelia]|uniref:Uncharacterized protein n=1 Tax=Paramecium pentaurelia TaxID=43138 RepID=A0A8S1UJ45_9CILI|nr:unnamed protein product [Paramecium pentaurelia]
MSFQFLKICFNNDLRRLRILKRFLFYKIQRNEFYRLEEIRNEMLNMKFENRESVKQTAGTSSWVLYLKKRQQNKSNWQWW